MILFLCTHSFCKSYNLVSCSQGPSCKMAGGCHQSHNGGSTSTPLWCFSSASSSASLEGECLLARRHLFCWLVVHAFSVALLFNQSVSIFIVYCPVLHENIHTHKMRHGVESIHNHAHIHSNRLSVCIM